MRVLCQIKDIINMAALAAADTGVIREGWLLKKKEGWKAMAMFEGEKRFVRLTADKVAYYSKESDDVAKGVFLLGPSLKVAADEEEKVTFSIFDDTRTITLQAENEEEREVWLRTILEAVAKLQGGGVHSRGLSDALESINVRFSNPVQRKSTKSVLKPGAHEGTLQKEGAWRWQERYFSLQDCVLSYWVSLDVQRLRSLSLSITYTLCRNSPPSRTLDSLAPKRYTSLQTAV